MAAKKKAVKKLAKQAVKKAAKKVAKKTTAKKVAKKKVAPKKEAKKVAPTTTASAKKVTSSKKPAVDKPKPATLSAVTPKAEKVVKKVKKTRVTKAQQAAIDEEDMLSKKWAALSNKASQIKLAPYNMRESYEAQTALDHKVLGWGFILDNKNDRLEVLFESGIKVLISNYK